MITLLKIFFVLVFRLIKTTNSTRFIKSSSLLTCMKDSQLKATRFDAVFFPDTNIVHYDFKAFSYVDDYVDAYFELSAYSITLISKNVSVCSLGFPSICPLKHGTFELKSNSVIDKSITSKIPKIAYYVPDIEVKIKFILYNIKTKKQLACVEAPLTNGKTVQKSFVTWPIAIISCLAVFTSAVVSIIGHSSTASHIASNSMSLFIYFQSLSIISMMGVAKIPPIAAGWSQNFAWSLGVINVDFVQKISNWYLQATGGVSTSILKIPNLSISVQKKFKRSVENIANIDASISDSFPNMLKKSYKLANEDFIYRDSLDNSLYSTSEKEDLDGKILILRGIQRVAFLSKIEITDLFMTAFIFLSFFAFVLIILFFLFKLIIDLLAKFKFKNNEKILEFKRQWQTIFKGALFRFFLIGFPQISLMCMWEFCQIDSISILILAIILFLSAFFLLYHAAIKILIVGKKSIMCFKNPAYMLYGNRVFLNKYGFIYVHYRANCYYMVFICLTYIFIKCLFVALLQKHGKIQSLVLFSIELFYFIMITKLKPFMDKRTNYFNIAISLISTLNSLAFVFFSYVFSQPHIISSIIAIIFFLVNAIFSIFLVIFTFLTCTLALMRKNPDARNKPMNDDRVSFLQKPTGVLSDDPEKNDELLRLGQTAMQGHENNLFVNKQDDFSYTMKI